MANDRSSLEKLFGLGPQAVDTGRQDGLYRGWNLNGGQRLHQPIGPRGAH
jgi:hypothetical protein